MINLELGDKIRPIQVVPQCFHLEDTFIPNLAKIERNFRGNKSLTLSLLARGPVRMSKATWVAWKI